jgi:hypothetical protein
MMQTYPALNPYLKGVHGTLDSWRRKLDINGFRMPDDKKRSRKNEEKGGPPAEESCDGANEPKRKKYRGTEFKKEVGSRKGKRQEMGNRAKKNQLEPPESMFVDPEDPLSWEEKFGSFNLDLFDDSDGCNQPPVRVRPVKRLKADILAMMELTKSEEAPRRSVRPGKRAHAVYGFGDASKDGFGESIEIEGKGIVWRSGTWNMSMREESSNYRAFRNLVEMVESLVAKGTLCGHELFLFTDTATAEAAFFKGTSTSEKLFELVLRLRKIEMKGELFLHLVHVSGTRMIYSGVDGLSRGDHNSGIMAGDSMLSFVPLSQNAAERSSSLLPWVRSWAAPKDTNKEVKHYHQPTEWCDPHPSGGTYVWIPPPAAAFHAVEWLAQQSIHKRPDSVHVMLVPRLVTNLWRKRLSKTSDLLFTIPLESKVVWKKENHEPLICALCLPLSQASSWSHRGTARVYKGVFRRLSPLWEVGDDAPGRVLRELLVTTRSLGKV